MTELQVDFDERAAILEYDGGLPRAEAEQQALAEIYSMAIDDIPPGVLGELIAADRIRRDMRVANEVSITFGHVRFPWGLGWVVPDERNYRPADRGERSSMAFIVPAVAAGCLVDLVAQTFCLKGIRSRLGATSLLGVDDVETARIHSQPLYVFASIPQWLKGGGHGAVVVDWRRAAHELDGVPAILCSPVIAERIYSVTRQCVPPPVVATPNECEVHRAA